MDRKTFLRRSLAAGVASGGAALLGGTGLAQTDDGHTEREQRFKEAWVESLMENLEEQFDEEERIGLMESCGRACAKRGAIGLADACKGDLGRMADRLSGIPDLEIENNSGDVYRVTYRKCFCELVGNGPDRLPDTYCECSRGWLLEMFGTAAEKAVEVEIVQTIKRGGNVCEFIVRV